jgi:hypothetical protein
MEVLRDLAGLIRHCNRSPPSQQLLGPTFMEWAASRRPSHAFSLNPNSGPVCPASNIRVALVRWPLLNLRVAGSL